MYGSSMDDNPAHQERTRPGERRNDEHHDGVSREAASEEQAAEARVPKHDLPEGFRLVHNFFPGPAGNDAPLAETVERHCHCGWLDGREHYGTVRVITAEGEGVPAYRTGERMIIESSP
jgi:hypothetical protein